MCCVATFKGFGFSQKDVQWSQCGTLGLLTVVDSDRSSISLHHGDLAAEHASGGSEAWASLSSTDFPASFRKETRFIDSVLSPDANKVLVNGNCPLCRLALCSLFCLGALYMLSVVTRKPTWYGPYILSRVRKSHM